MNTITLHNGSLKFSAYQHGFDNPDAALVLCLHGFPDNANSFRFQIDELLKAGYRVLTPTMRGYEPSSIPGDNNFSVAAMAQDVIAWLNELNISQVHLVGHDWGSAIAYTVAAIAPHRFLSLTTIAVPHPRRFSREGMKNVPGQAFKSWYMLFNQIPVFSDYILRRNDCAFLRYLWRKWSPNQVLTEEEWANLTATFLQPGVVKAMLSYYRQNVSPGQLLGFRKSANSSLREIPVPNMAITGADDGCIDTRVFDYTILQEDHPRGFRLERIPGAGHFTHQDKPAIVNKLLIEWFRSNEASIAGE